MKHVKSERLKKLEGELTDLEQWLKLGLVPKKDLQHHKEEIALVTEKIKEEKDRLQFLKESGEGEEFIAPKRPAAGRGGFTDMPTIPDIEAGETQGGYNDSNYEAESDYETSDTYASEATEETETVKGEKGEGKAGEEEDDEEEEEEEKDDDYFSDRNRWRREGIVDPEADQW